MWCTPLVRRIQLYLDEELDDALSSRSAQTGRSKSELLREAVRGWITVELDGADVDALDAIVGSVDVDPVGDIDHVIYAG